MVTPRGQRPDPARQLDAASRSIHVCILLLLRDRPTHGYALLQRLCELGVMTNNRARIYRALRWLEDAGFVVCSWDTPQVGAARRVYRTSPAGRRALATALPSRLVAGETTARDPMAALILTLARKSCAS